MSSLFFFLSTNIIDIYYMTTYNFIRVVDMISSISVSELSKLLDRVKIIDIRSVEKYNDNHIPGAINIPDEKLLANYKKYLLPNEMYYLYCQKGIKSLKISQILNRLGYHTANLNGGYESWILDHE